MRLHICSYSRIDRRSPTLFACLLYSGFVGKPPTGQRVGYLVAADFPADRILTASGHADLVASLNIEHRLR